MKGQLLVCGCCGVSFRIGDDYIDRGEDHGYGTCPSCVAEIKAGNTALMTTAIDQLAAALSDDRRATFEAMPRHRQEFIAMHAMEQGILQWTI